MSEILVHAPYLYIQCPNCGCLENAAIHVVAERGVCYTCHTSFSREQLDDFIDKKEST